MNNVLSGLIVAVLACEACIGHDQERAEDNSKANAQDKAGALTLGPDSAQRNFIKVEAVEESELAGLLILTGRVTFDENHTQRVSSPIDGRVTGLFVEPGDDVKAGQRLLELSSPDVGRLQSDAQKAAQDLNIAQRSLERVQRLRSDGAVSDKELMLAESEFKKARSQAASNDAQLSSLGISASDPTVKAALRAQIAGTVVARTVLAGQEVRADAVDPLVTITDLQSVWVLADVYEQDLGLVANGDTVLARTPAYPDQVFQGTVAHIGDVVDAQSRTVKMRCSFQNAGHLLKPEMFVKVDVRPKTSKKVISIPSRAVVNHGEVSTVILALADNTFRSRKVDVGPEQDGRVRLLDGLNPGDRIVTEGALFLDRELRE